MLEQAKQMYKDAHALHRIIYEDTIKLREKIRELNLGDLADLAYAMREAMKLLDDTKKAMKEVQATAEKFATLTWMTESQVLGEQYRIKTESGLRP